MTRLLGVCIVGRIPWDWKVELLTHRKGKVVSPIGITRTPTKSEGLDALTKQRDLADCKQWWDWMFLEKKTQCLQKSEGRVPEAYLNVRLHQHLMQAFHDRYAP